jgi:hypothetical protein
MAERRRLSAQEIAFWRYEQIEQALDPAVHRDVRGEIVRRLSRAPVRWPSGVTKRIAIATLYRWIERLFCVLRTSLATITPASESGSASPLLNRCAAAR